MGDRQPLRVKLVSFVQLLRLGGPAHNAEPLGDLFAWWARCYGSRYESLARIEDRWRRHLAPLLAQLTEEELTPDRLELELGALRHLGPQTWNHCRTDLRRVIRAAIGARRWSSPDPTAYVRPRRVPRRAWPTLTRDEALAVFAQLEGADQALVMTTAILGLRKGELLGLDLLDLDLAHQELAVRRSHGRDTTKTGQARVLPVPAILLPILEAQAARGGPRWLFPGGGSQGRRGSASKLARKLRAALCRAGLTASWARICRRKGCGWREEGQREAGSPGPARAVASGSGSRPGPARSAGTTYATPPQPSCGATAHPRR